MFDDKIRNKSKSHASASALRDGKIWRVSKYKSQRNTNNDSSNIGKPRLHVNNYKQPVNMSEANWYI